MEPYYEDPECFWEVLPDNLTDIEYNVVEKLRLGYTFREIEELFDRSETWVRNHFNSAKEKIRIANKDE